MAKFQSALITSGTDTSVGLTGKDSIGAHGGDETRSFLQGLNPEYQCMLAYTVDGEHSTSYCNLLLVAQKLERWAGTRDPLFPKSTTTGRSNVTQPQAPGNLFPSRNLKDNCTFMVQSAIVGSIGTEGNSSVKLEGEEEVESSEGEDQETPNEIGKADQLISYIIHYANTVKLYQKKN